MNKKRVLVLMSGGVDSSVAAALLKKQSYDVIGVYLKLWEERKPAINPGWEIGDPCWVHDKRDTEKVAAKLKIPFFVLDVTREYKKRVMDYFFKEYAAGRTPNPDVMCNKEVKFGFVLKKAFELGYDYVATGHYAKIQKLKCKMKNYNSKFKIIYSLRQAHDANKDQSYFLWTLTQKQLSRILFPLGNLTKPQVRQMAKKLGLPTWAKKDSQGICFLGKIDLADFLKKKIKTKKGKIIDLRGKVLGEHQGVWYYTIGQRTGLKIGGAGPYYVLNKDLKNNILTVVSPEEEDALFTKTAIVKNINWISGKLALPASLYVRARYREPLLKAKIATRARKSFLKLTFVKPIRALTAGQSAVFYDKGRCLGGGVIA